jgi:Animal haem peroxidase
MAQCSHASTGEHPATAPRRTYSRRSFFGRFGAATAGVALAGCDMAGGPGGGQPPAVDPTQAPAPPPIVPLGGAPNTFGRLFPDLPPFAEDSQALQEALVEIGSPGGIMDANDNLAAGPVELITDLSLSENNQNNANHSAGITFIGQFIDHDLTRDLNSPLGVPADPGDHRNGRIPAFDLDSVYSRGPRRDRQYYDPQDRIKLPIESGGLFEDFARQDGVAIIPDARNDENMMIAGIHQAIMLFHNKMVDQIREQTGGDDQEVFAEARRLTRWHYQWIVMNEVLPKYVGQAEADAALARPNIFRRRRVRMPVEFQGAAYRFGHSLVRPSYRANLEGDNGQPFFGMIFDAEASGPDPADLRGGARAPRRFIGWQTFFDFGDGEVKPNKRIDTTISTPMFNLPPITIELAPGTPLGPTALAARNLLRHITWSQPSGQDIADEYGVERLAPADLSDLADFGLGLEESTPLWFYALREADVMADGRTLGPVGGRIIADCYAGFIRSDESSFMSRNPDWTPTVETRSGDPESFDMVDFLTFAEVDPASRRAALGTGNVSDQSEPVSDLSEPVPVASEAA